MAVIHPQDKQEDTGTDVTHQKPVWRGIVGSVGVLLLAPLIAVLLTAFVFQSYQVDGVSMQNTLQNNDRLIVWKGSATWAHLFGEQYIPNRGDIVIVDGQDLTACGQTSKAIIKRVIGLPGERVVYKDGRYTVYNAEHPNGFDPDTTLPYGKADTALLSNPQDMPTGQPTDVTLTGNQLFVSGDHRAASCDSRTFGPVQTNRVVGKVAARILPLSTREKF